ncbi:hypothetical protein LEP1GSC036_1703 [Leptospira weilii str. 2006001853]|uniref:Uncharacterized protein n=2 Tax=Leptospira weilii TaxID=28184 RepID=A0A828YWN1_9LEPT|nr:hypothetical protein LEP1GSC036_1703 [Leptospira weilii str. 2006001853]EMM70836.1 hypothetical protein LEP1GSC038_2397 [Leptospira weilii str. 2006001855]
MNIQIYCNSAVRNIYPSNMQRSMGTGRKGLSIVFERTGEIKGCS